jgi:hypothetical protein
VRRRWFGLHDQFDLDGRRVGHHDDDVEHADDGSDDDCRQEARPSQEAGRAQGVDDHDAFRAGDADHVRRAGPHDHASGAGRRAHDDERQPSPDHDHHTGLQRHQPGVLVGARRHLDAERPPAELWNEHQLEALGLGPLIELDTSGPVDAGPVADRIKALAGRTA